MSETMNLGGRYQLISANGQYHTTAEVPGTVLTALYHNGLIPDPFYRDNEDIARALSYDDYTFERTFTISSEQLSYDNAELVCFGIDTAADIIVNGIQTATVGNMHRTWRFPVKKLLHMGENRLSVVIHSPTRIIDQAQEDGVIHFNSCGTMPGAQYIRKAHCMFGWDWGPQMPDGGIWRPIQLEFWNTARLHDVLVNQEHTDRSVCLETKINLVRNEQTPVQAVLTLTDPDGRDCLKQVCEIDGTAATARLEITTPRLWWPNGYGDQPLYSLEISLQKNGCELDRYQARLGLRTLTVSNQPDQYGEEFAFEVNGVKIFSMGADYIPEDSLFGRFSKERTEKLLDDCIEANYNTIRVWGGGHYASDDFYNACDERGLIVWQDFMFACLVYEITDEFQQNVAAEMIDNICRIRNHPSLGLLCGNNENEQGWLCWDYVECSSERHKEDYLRLTEQIMPQVVKEYAPQVFYWPSSPSAGGNFTNTMNENYGDAHYWNVWHGLEPFHSYKDHYFRYCSEYGFQSFPAEKTIRTFAEPDDCNIFSRIMELHQKNGAANGKILSYIAESYRYPTSFRNLLYCSQLLQAEAVRTGAEHFRRNRGRCMGSLYWQVNDCWPVASWSSIDYFGRWKGLHYYAKRFYAPCLLSCDVKSDRFELHLSNETMKQQHFTVRWSLNSQTGKCLLQDSCEISADALSDRVVCSITLPEGFDKRRDYLAFSLMDGEKVLSHTVEIFCLPKHYEFLKPKISTVVSEEQDQFVISVTSDVMAKSVELDFAQLDARFSDNWFDLLPGEAKVVTIPKKLICKEITAKGLADQLLINTVYDIGR